MLDKIKNVMAGGAVVGLLAASFLFAPMTASNVAAAENNSRSNIALPAIEVPKRSLQVVKTTALVQEGATLETVVIYDDPSTSRPQDYLELYDRDGNLVVVAWFDRFGIQRVAVDRAFVEGEDQLEGVFVAVVDGNFI